MNRRADAVADVERRLGHCFVNRALLERALTHSSAAQGRKDTLDNERLEFLGDRVLGMIVAEELMRRDPGADEGQLSKRLHALVDKDSCAEVASELGLGAALRLPGGETRRGARENASILADACEALIAALYLEAGFETARRAVLDLWESAMARPFDDTAINPKSELQEWAASLKKPLPAYQILSREGPDHAPTFLVQAAVEGFAPAQASGRSRQEAEKAAAETLLRRERPS